MTRFLQGLAGGLGSGAVYALLALGYVVIYKSTSIISFAQPGLMVVGAAWVAFLRASVGLNFFLAMLLSMLITALIGAAIERSALRPMVGKPVFTVAIITIGIDVILRVGVNRFIGVDARNILDPFGIKTITLGGVIIQQRHIAAVVVTAVLVGLLFAFFKFSRVGLGMRAAAYDQEVALAQGISVGLIFGLSWAIAGAAAAAAGTMAVTGSVLDQGTWIVALKALPAIILGGLDSIGGAVVGGLIVGVVEALVSTYQGQYAPWLGNNFFLVSPYVLMLIILLVRPYGLFGTPEVRRV